MELYRPLNITGTYITDSNNDVLIKIKGEGVVWVPKKMILTKYNTTKQEQVFVLYPHKTSRVKSLNSTIVDYIIT